MTFREKLQMEYPEYVSNVFEGGCKGCPENYGYEERTTNCCADGPKKCTYCWNREIKQTYEDGLNEAWELIKKLHEMEYVEKEKIFPSECEGGIVTFNIIEKYTAKETLNILAEYKLRNNIKTGDVVTFGNQPQCYVVLSNHSNESSIWCYKLSSDDNPLKLMDLKSARKTGTNINMLQLIMDACNLQTIELSSDKLIEKKV